MQVGKLNNARGKLKLWGWKIKFCWYEIKIRQVGKLNYAGWKIKLCWLKIKIMHVKINLYRIKTEFKIVKW